MALIPDNYLYLVDIETERVLAVFPIDQLSRELEVISLESQLRVEQSLEMVCKIAIDSDPADPASFRYDFTQGQTSTWPFRPRCLLTSWRSNNHTLRRDQ